MQDNGVDPTKVRDANCSLSAAREIKAAYFVTGIVSQSGRSRPRRLSMSVTAGREEDGPEHWRPAVHPDRRGAARMHKKYCAGR